jgi:hypothetical protein
VHEDDGRRLRLVRTSAGVGVGGIALHEELHLFLRRVQRASEIVYEVIGVLEADR